MDENIASTNVQDNEQVEVTQKSLENTNTNTDDTAIAIIESNESIMKKSATSLSRPSIMCRICLNNGDIERLLTPCQCKGTQGYVHRGCLEYWLSTSGLSHCELCLFHFETIDCLRYGMWESMRIWFSHPSNRALLQSDIMLCTMLTFITFGLMVISMFAMYYLAGAPSENSAQVEATKYWMDTSVGVFLGIVVSYISNYMRQCVCMNTTKCRKWVEMIRNILITPRQ
ncbi:hypothetical protein PVAND_007592 [Polypedilum vanderplanki]|uniref:RING-CH-type domain-containing protein n=1 Tax=Polypedilum vanderplanki TaxID=319348 RepID=A0A9J6C7T9_POLVA|nr:hypothetical protein PVAND_007592 [Polypedilum vanderplanki]